MLVNIVLILIGLGLLVAGADWLVRGSSSLAKKLKVSNLVIGLTVVAFGTSTPELTVSLTASLQGSSAIALSNAVGSNIANILLILGVCALFRTLTVKSATVWKEIPLAFAGMLLLFVFANDHFFDAIPSNALTRTDGFALLTLFAIFMYYIFGLARTDKEVMKEASSADIKTYALPQSFLLVLIGLSLLVIGGKLLVDNAVDIALAAGLSEALIGLTIVAIGTSLPELATSLVATLKGQNDIAVGNVIGSNIFNTFWIMGISSSVRAIPISNDAILDLLIGVIATLFLFFFMFVGKKHGLTRMEGSVMLSLYVAYTAFLIYRG